MTVRERLREGDFNTMNNENQPDGSMLVTLTKYGDPHVYKMLVKDLHGEHEEVLWEKVTEV